jgi:cytochrome c oxidase cbb3-type subunit 1
MIRRRAPEVELQPSPAADPETVRISYQYLLAGTLWLLVGTVVGLIAALKLNRPDLFPASWLSYGRIRPIHTNTLFWGWSSMSLVGLALYVVSSTSRVPLWSPRLSRVALVLWNLAVLGGILSLASGVTNGPNEYREWIWPLAVVFGSGLVLNGINVYRTVASRSSTRPGMSPSTRRGSGAR